MLPWRLRGTELESHPCKENPVRGDAFLSLQCQGSRVGQIPMAEGPASSRPMKDLLSRQTATWGMTPRLTSSLHLHVLMSTHVPVHSICICSQAHFYVNTHVPVHPPLHRRKTLIVFPWAFPEKQLPAPLPHSCLRKWRPADGSKLWRHLNDSSCP